ncbi:MAG: GatB/YqeY domain-containing protein [Parcubacteria group bacterium]
MPLKERIASDLKTALKNADSFRLGVLRLISSAFQNEAIAKRTRGQEGDLTEDELIAVLKHEAKKRRESIDAYGKGGRSDLVESEERELKIIKEYLPPELSREKIEEIVKRIVESGVKEFPLVMKAAMAELKNAADGKAVSEVVKSILG